MQGNAQVRARLDHLLIALRSCVVAQSLPIGEMGLDSDTQCLASHVKRLVNPWCATMDDNQIGAIPREQTVQNLLREVITSPVSVACDWDTHVQIIASVGSRYQMVPRGSSD
jgi:hypothetical protein